MTDTKPKPAPPAPPRGADAAELLSSAEAYEAAGLWLAVSPSAADRRRSEQLLTRADALHAARLVDRDSADAWATAAASGARVRGPGAGAELSRRALEVDPSHAPALLLLAASSLESVLEAKDVHDRAADAVAAAAAEATAEAAAAAASAAAAAEPEAGAEAGAGAAAAAATAEGGSEEAATARPAAGGAPTFVPDAAALEAAVVAATALVEVRGADDPLPWALLALAYAADPALGGPCRSNTRWAACRQKLSQLERAALAGGGSDGGGAAGEARGANGYHALSLIHISEPTRRS
eukprot:7372-Chlamydomonas_euryale.AAC.1